MRKIVGVVAWFVAYAFCCWFIPVIFGCAVNYAHGKGWALMFVMAAIFHLPILIDAAFKFAWQDEYDSWFFPRWRG
jgi:hypothetical protein